jgi:sigma-B regulation protein RsbU (phosphoserine phosphatase)
MQQKAQMDAHIFRGGAEEIANALPPIHSAHSHQGNGRPIGVVAMVMDAKHLQQEIQRLTKEKAVYQAQSRMLDHFVSVARASANQKMVNATLQKTLEVSIGLTGAEKGSLFLIDENGVVIDSILTRTQASSEERSRLIGTVLDQGLAGWVRRHCDIAAGNCHPAYICDTEKDDRWLTLPGQPYEVRSALVVPIVRKDRLLGLLTLLHSLPEHFSAESLELIEMTAVQIGVVLENATLYAKLEESLQRVAQAKREVEVYSRALDLEMQKGRKIQQDFLPEKLPRAPGWDIAACLHPAIQVSGDFYDVFELSRHHLGLVMADVCDKGVGAALFMALFRSLVRVYTFGGGVSPRFSMFGAHIALEAVRDTNAYIARHHGKLAMFATMFVGVLDTKTGDLTYINAGHEPPVILTQRGGIDLLRPTGPAVGLLPKTNFISQQVRLDPGDTLVAFTDGVTEAASPSKEIFGRQRLHSKLKTPFSSAADTIEHIRRETFDHIGRAPQSDDITLLCVHRLDLA